LSPSIQTDIRLIHDREGFYPLYNLKVFVIMENDIPCDMEDIAGALGDTKFTGG
jgi:hypothetical protein